MCFLRPQSSAALSLFSLACVGQVLVSTALLQPWAPGLDGGRGRGQKGSRDTGLSPFLPGSPRDAVKALWGLPSFSAACFSWCTCMFLGACGRARSPPLRAGVSCMLTSAELFLGTLTPLQCALPVCLWCSGLNSPLGWDLQQQPPLPSPAEPWGCQELLAPWGQTLPS